MQGELPQELSVTALEVLGTGTGHAEGHEHTVSCVFKLDDVNEVSDRKSFCAYIF